MKDNVKPEHSHLKGTTAPYNAIFEIGTQLKSIQHLQEFLHDLEEMGYSQVMIKEGQIYAQA
jgi:hypothetical protein